MLSTHAKGLLITALGVLVISPDGLLTRLILTDHWTMIFYRALFVSFGMWLVVSFTCPNRVWQQYRTVRGPGLIMVGLYALGTISFIYAITHTSVANTLIILSTTPLFAALVSWLLLKERLELRTLVAIALVALGVGIIGSGSIGQPGGLAGDLAAVLGSFCLGSGFVFVRRFPGVSVFPAISCSGLLTAAPLSVTESDLGYLLIMGIYMVPIGSALMYLGPRYIPAAEVGLLMLLESILGPLWVWLILEEEPGHLTLLGGAIVISTLAINTVWKMKSSRVESIASG